MDARQLAVVLCTVPDLDAARRLAWLLVEGRHAACVNILPQVTSVYRWEGGVEEDGELLLVVKTSWDEFPALRDRIVEEHPYDVPEIVALPIHDVLEGYGSWVLESVGGGKESPES